MRSYHLLVCAALALSSCTSAPPRSTAPEPEPEPVPREARFPGTVGATNVVHQVEGVAIVRALRSASHNGYDRVVIEFDGDQVPGYHAEYIDKPVRDCGSGDPVQVAGDAWLEIRMTPAAAHTESGVATLPSRTLRPEIQLVRQIERTCDFEAMATFVLGVGYPGRYRILELQDPARLVVDVRHAP